MDVFRRCLKPTLSFSLLLLVTPLPVMAGYSRFGTDTLVLEIACLEIVENGEATGPGGQPLMYSAAMDFDGQAFRVIDLAELDDAEECLATFDMATNELTDQVRFGDKIFDVVLNHTGSLRFVPEALSFRERAPTALWRVSDGDNELFIGGTIHILHEDDIPLPEIFIEAYILSDILVTEAGTLDTDGGETGEPVENPYEFTDGTTLSGLLLPSTVDAVNESLAPFDLSIEDIDVLKPFFAARLLLFFNLYAQGFGPGVDDLFYALADLQGRPILGLETAASQVDAVDAAYEDSTADELILAFLELARSEDYAAYLRYLITVWREGDIEYLAELNRAEKEADEDYYNAILKNRNEAWIPRIQEFMATEEVEFVLMGMAHVAGEDSVLSMLEALGYTVELYR